MIITQKNVMKVFKKLKKQYVENCEFLEWQDRISSTVVNVECTNRILLCVLQKIREEFPELKKEFDEV